LIIYKLELQLILCSNVQVVLQILTALIEKVPRELPLYGHSILNILETVLRSNDIAMVEETLQTFETFCSNQDLAILAAEQRYATQYERIVRSYAEFASSKSNIPSKSVATTLPTRLRWKNIGLKATRSIVSSEGLSADGGKPLTFILPVILENVYDGGEDLLIMQRTSQTVEKTTPEQGRRRRASTVTVRTVDTAEGNVAEASGTTADADKIAELEVRLLALRCLERIFVVSSNRSQIRTAAGLVLQFIVSKRESSSENVLQGHGNWANSLMDLITKWCPVQDRFIILFTAVEILRGISSDGQPIGQQIVMASLIDSLLKSPVNMIGLSVIDVLVGFVQHILRLLQAPSSQPSLSTPTDSVTNGAFPPGPILTDEHAKLVSLLKQCIADLATHNYYADQISDMIRTLLTRIRPLASQDLAASTTTKASSDPSVSVNYIPSIASERHVENYFYSAASRIVALEAVKDILEVANQGKTTTGLSIEPRNKVGIQVWEGTHWLLRDSDRDVRNAYTSAFVSWLGLETTKNDLKAPDSASSRPSRAQSRREQDGPRRTASLAPTDKLQNHVSSVFLQLLHLAVYETAVEYAESKADILVVYALLVNLVEHLGVNAVRFGLPMVMKLQSDFFGSSTSRINIGSLVYGYLNALVVKFDFEDSRVGNEIQSEISSRKNCGAWLEMVLLPPVPLSQIPPSSRDSLPRPALQQSLRYFTSVDELARHIEDGYVASLTAALQSPPGSPGKQVASQGAGHGYFEAGQNPPALPAVVKDDMLSAWSKEACISIIEKEKARAVSVAGSKSGNSIRRGHGSHLNGYGSHTPNDTGSPISQHDHNNAVVADTGPSSSSSSQGYRRQSNRPDGSPGVSSRDSTIRVNDLKRMLTVAGNSNVRRSSPLRGRLDAAGNSSILSSSSESFASGTFSASEYDAESRPQSIREGSETPKASSSSQAGGSEYNFDIPPVPPLPLGLVIPGEFPDSSSNINVSRQNSTRSAEGRSSGSPSQMKSSSRSTSAQLGRSLSGKRTRSINSLHKATSLKQQQQQGASHGPSTGTDTIRRDIEKLLDGVLSHDNNSNALASIDINQGVTPRRTTSGIGRPPY
jgi:protein EFR3